MDFTLGRGFNVINIALVFIIQALHAALFGLIASRLTARPLAIIAVSIVSILLFSFGQAENLTWGFQVQFVGVYAAVTLALWLALAIERQKTGAPSLGLALGAAATLVVATYTMSNGVLCGLAMIFAALALRARQTLTIAFAALTAILLFAYFYHFRPVASHSPPGFSVQHPLDFAAYALVYLGGVVGPFGAVRAALLGGAGLAVTAFAAVRLVLRKDQGAASATLTGVMIFFALTAIATAFGRAFFGLDQALSSRYFTPAAVFWSAQVVYLASFVRPASVRFAGNLPFAVIALVVGAGAIRAHFAERSYARQHYQDIAFASDALLSGVEPNEAMLFAYPDPDVPRREAPFLNERRLSIFAWPEGRLRGQALSAPYPKVDDDGCRGAFDITETLAENEGVEVSGWAWDRRRKAAAQRVLLVDAHDVVVGFVTGGWLRPDVRRIVPEVHNREVGWRGFASVPGGELLRAYAVLSGGAAVCLLGAHATAPDERIGAPPIARDVSILGAAIQARAALSGGWTVNGQHPSAGAFPVDGLVFGSWSGADANQGELTLGPFVAPEGAFALPFVSGPSTHGQSILVKDAETGEIYIRFKPAARVQWSTLVLTIPPDKASRPLLLVATDHGGDWGQWIAVGQPRAVVR